MAESNETIMIVDDEDMVLQSVRNSLILDTDYNVITFTSAKGALAELENTKIDLIMSDYLMPEMNGIDFLLKVKAVQPMATRILLTAYADKENAIKAINELGLFQYIEKPWEDDHMKLVIRNGVERKRLLGELESRMDEIAKTNSDLKTLNKEIIKAFV